MSVICLRTEAKTLLAFHKFVQRTAGQESDSTDIHIFPPQKAANYNIPPHLDFGHWNGFCTRYFLYFCFPFPMLFSVLFSPYLFQNKKHSEKEDKAENVYFLMYQKSIFILGFSKNLKCEILEGSVISVPSFYMQNRIKSSFWWKVF